ncbi:MAG: hypothetical protein V2A71_05435 [Candidatus Eisenbacteria bacterium]
MTGGEPRLDDSQVCSGPCGDGLAWVTFCPAKSCMGGSPIPLIGVLTNQMMQSKDLCFRAKGRVVRENLLKPARALAEVLMVIEAKASEQG